jgi:hypothetical protein
MTEFVDAQQQARLYGRTFRALSQESLAALRPGAFVKVATGGERFWVRLTQVQGDTLRGVIDNVLQNTVRHGLHMGDEVAFETRHVYQVILPS